MLDVFNAEVRQTSGGFLNLVSGSGLIIYAVCALGTNAVCGNLRDGVRQRAVSRLSVALVEFLVMIGDLYLPLQLVIILFLVCSYKT